MSKFNDKEKLGLRNMETDEVIAVYPYQANGNDQDIEKKVRDWYYMQGCSAEETLRSAYVDILTEEEALENKDLHMTCR